MFDAIRYWYDYCSAKDWGSTPSDKNIVEVKKWIKDDIKKEDNKVEKKNLEGFKRVAGIKFNDYGATYYYALYDEDVKVGDLVTVTGTADNRTLYEVNTILTVEELRRSYSGPVYEEVWGVLKADKFMAREEKRENLKKIREEMDKLIAKVEEDKVYARYAEIDPAIAELYAKYNEIRED